ncbi:MAG: Crp/Fnr family transcriptional regulator [Polaromonas sp.]|nr:Crp/Fnr family transcriptional regulator [Polaromonas sp.]
MSINDGEVQSSASANQVVAGADASAASGQCRNCASYEFCIMKGLSLKYSVDGGVPIKEHSFRKGETLAREGEHVHNLRIIKVGSVSLGRSSPGGHIHPIAISGRGAVVGICSYFGQPNQLGTVALSGGRFCEISTEVMVSLARSDRKIWDQVGLAHGTAFGLIAGWTHAISRPQIAGRVAHSLRLLMEVHHSPTVSLPSHAALAQLLGTTRESVARALALLEAQGCIVRRGRRVCEILPKLLSQWLSRQP